MMLDFLSLLILFILLLLIFIILGLISKQIKDSEARIIKLLELSKKL